MNMFLMIRAAKYDVALVGTNVGSHFDAYVFLGAML
jgi:hypothetical protein